MSKNSVWSIFSSRPLSCKVLFSCTLYIMYLSFVCYLGDFPRPYCSCTDVTFLDHTAVVLVVWLSQIILQLYWCDFPRPYCSRTGGVTFPDHTAVVLAVWLCQTLLQLYWWCDFPRPYCSCTASLVLVMWLQFKSWLRRFLTAWMQRNLR